MREYVNVIVVAALRQESANAYTEKCLKKFQPASEGAVGPPVRFLIEYRAQMAAMRLERTGDSISSIAEQCGFVSDSYFGKIFKDIYGCTPRDYRKKQRA